MQRNMMEIKCIGKPSTALAMAFLKAPFGAFHCKNQTNLRIITDMSRPQEQDGERAGAHFVKQCDQELPDLKSPVMIYTSNASKAADALRDLGVARAVTRDAGKVCDGTVVVTATTEVAESFCSFKDVPRSQ